MGVPGDSCSYAAVLAIERFPDEAAKLHDFDTKAINPIRGIKRVVAVAASMAPLGAVSVQPGAITSERHAILRRARAIVRRMSEENGFDAEPESVVPTPVVSVDDTTTRSPPIPEPDPAVAVVFRDLTHMPPAAIECECGNPPASAEGLGTQAGGGGLATDGLPVTASGWSRRVEVSPRSMK